LIEIDGLVLAFFREVSHAIIIFSHKQGALGAGVFGFAGLNAVFHCGSPYSMPSTGDLICDAWLVCGCVILLFGYRCILPRLRANTASMPQ
jgi:hypothetical protein